MSIKQSLYLIKFSLKNNMPTIQPQRLKQQAAELSKNYSDPEQFVRVLDALLSQYAERTIRPGQVGEPSTLLQKYGVPPPTLRYILLAVSPYAQSDPVRILILCDRLWKVPNLEFRSLAIGILGKISADQANQVVIRVKNWSQEESDRRLILNALDNGLSTVRKFHSELVLVMIQDWLNEPDLARQKLGLMGLLSLVSDPDFENLPIFFKLLTPVIVHIKAELRPELLDIMLVLARRSPRETAYFLQELLLIPGCLPAGWLARQLIPHLPETVATTVRQALHSVSNQPTRPITPRS